MNFKKIANSISIFLLKRLMEVIGATISLIGIFLFVSLITYSPSDPNFIFPQNTEIKNLMGFQGSYTSDLFLQTLGYISYLVSLTFFFIGFNIIKKKTVIYNY